MALPYLGIPQLAAVIYIPFFVLFLLCKLVFWMRIVYIQRPTLAPIPGPKWASWTRIWLVKTLASGDSARIFSDINKEYGRTPLNPSLMYLHD